MESLWNEYENCTDPQEQTKLWKELLPVSIKDFCIANSSLHSCTKFANRLARKFLSAIYEQCSVCEDEPDSLVQFLSTDYGCHLLFSLNCFASQVTSCCDELCTLLLSIVPLIFQSQHSEECRKYDDFFSVKSDLFSSQWYFLYISRKLCNLPTDNLENGNSSSDDESRDSNQTKDTCPDEEVLETIEGMKLDHQQLFFHLFSTILGLVQNDVVSKDHNCCMSYLEKCFALFSPDSTQQGQNQNLSWYHHYGMNHLTFVLLNGLSNSKDGLEKILSNTYYTNFYTVIQSYTQKLSQPIYLFLSLNSMCHITTCLSQSLNLCMTSSCHNSDLLKLFSKFIQLNYLELLKKILIELDTSFADDPDNLIRKQCYQRADVTLKHLVKMSKQVKCIKGYCDEVNHKGQAPFTTKMHSLKEGSKGSNRQSKHISSDEEPVQKTGKHFNNSNNQSEESAENVSDFHDLLFDESSDSGVERRVKEKNTNKKSVETVAARKEECFISTCIHALSECFVKVRNQQQLQLMLLHSMAHIGVCRCIDLDPFLLPIVSSLSTCNENIMDKTLSLVCFLLSSNWDNINQKSPGKRRYSNRHRSKSRTSSSTTVEDIKPNADKNVSTTFHFLTKFKTYLSSQMTVLKNLLLKHLKLMAKKMPQNMQQELFRTILLPNFRSMFLIGKIKIVGVQISMSEDLSIINSYLDLLYICMTNNDDLAVLFHKYEGSDTLHNLALIGDYETSSKAVIILEYLYHLGTPSYNTTLANGNKKHRSRNVDESFTATLKDISDKAISTLMQVGSTQLNSALDKNLLNLFTDKNCCLLDVLQVLLEILHERDTDEEMMDPTVTLKCEKLLGHLFDEIIGNISSEESQESNVKELYTENYLVWLKVLLPIQLFKKTDESSHAEIMGKLKQSFLHNRISRGSFGEQVFLTLLNCSTIGMSKTKPTDVSEKEEMLIDLKSTVDLNADDRTESNSIQLEEKGYEADQDSDDSSDYPASSHHTHLFVTDHGKSKTSLLTNTKMTSGRAVVQVKHPWLIINLLEYLAEKVEEDKKTTLTIVKAAMNLIYEYLLLDPTNIFCLREQNLLVTVLNLYNFVFMDKFEETKDVQETLGKMIVQLTGSKINATELKRFLELFKIPGIDKKCLSKILWKISQVYEKQSGPRYHLVFPAILNKESEHAHPQGKLQHRTQAFMIPKQEPAFRQSQLRSQSLSSMYELRDSMLKPISYSNQPSSWEASALQLPLGSTFTWPDKEFSLCLWYMLEDSGVKCMSKNSGSSPKEKHFMHRQQSITLISQQSHESYGCEELYHLCSFGGPNAMFEVWIGARTGYFQYRWITSCYGNPDEEQLISYDQVVIHHHSEKNKWHHLAVSLVLPSKSQTSEIVSFLDGCQMPSVQMKYPGQGVQNQVKLSLLMGHGVKENATMKVNDSRKPTHLLKTGVFMVFQGKTSFKEKGGTNIVRRIHHQPLVDKVKAIYLYYLGPNNANIDTEYQEYFSNQNTSHMDSSLDWDSIMFKELSFCMSVLSEKLVSDKFPMDLLESPIEVLTNIKAELQTTLMIIFNPRNQKEFLQFIPQLKTLGNIQHTYLNDVSILNEKNDGTALPSVAFCKLQLDVMESFKDAVHNCGGISILLYLHALVAEDQCSEDAQCAVLQTIFSIQENCSFLLREMNDLAGYVLIKRTLHQSPCTLNTSLMRALLESSFDGDLFLAGDTDDYTTVVVNQNTSAIVKNVCILQMLLKDWVLIRKADFEVQEILWQALETLVRPSHPNVKFNVAQFQRARVVENLLIGCQEVQQERYFQLPASICRLFIGVITNLLGQPADLPVLKAICSFLIAIHPTLDTLTLHSAQNFYLIGKVHIATASNVKLKETPKRFTKVQRSRRTASFNEADLKSPTGPFLSSISPQVILSREDLASGSMLQSEVILKRASVSSLKDSLDVMKLNDDNVQFSTPAKNIHLQPSYGVDEIDSKESNEVIPPFKTPFGKIKGHRRIQSDGNIRPSTIALDIPMKSTQSQSARKDVAAMDSQDYDIISDSELASSCEGHEEYLVVDGFIDQTLESFTPTAKEERNIPAPDVLYHLRLGMMQLLKNTLMLLPDNLVTRVFGTILRVEHLLVLVNQSSDKLREVALENLILYLQRGGRDCLANFNRFKGCHLLANQLHQHPVTLKIIESCITLLVSKPLTLNPISEHLEIHDDNICLMAIVPCVTLLESSIQRPFIFGQFVKFLLKIFDRIEDLPLVAFEHGLADIVSNIVCGLTNEESGGMMTCWKRESFGHLLHLLDWLVNKACCTCQTLYFQMYKDLQLSLENIDSREKEKRGAVFPLLSKTCRFLKYYLIQSALNVFKENDLYMALTRMANKEDPQYIVPPEVYGASIKSSAARNFMKKIRGSVQLLPQPTVATPTEIQERFQDVLSEAVKLATLFNKSDHQTDTMMFGHKLKCLSCVHTHGDGKAVSPDADREFCKDILEWFCKNILVILSPVQDNSSWCSLLKSLKDEFITQAGRVFINFVSPLRSKELRLHFVRQVMLYKDNKAMYQTLLLTNFISKTRERFLACLHSILSIPQIQFTEEERDMLQKFKKLIGRGNLMKVNDQKLLSEMSELRHKRREEEMLKRREAYKRILERNSQLCKSIADHGMEVSKVIVEEQDRQRQKLLRVVRGKVSKDVEIRKTWRNLIHHVTQERALWYCDDCYPCSWQLDPTEGPFRMRKRLQRCNLEIPPKFFMESSLAKKPINIRGLLSYLFTEHFDGEQPVFYSFKTNDTIRFLYHCKRVTPATKNAGEVLIGETHMYFVGDEILTDNNVTQAFFGDKDVISISWRYEEIHEILKRRYSLQDNALEIFLTSGRTFLLAFESTKSRDEVFEQLMSRELPNLVTATMDVVTLTNKWKEGSITNFEYLTELNKKAGRSFNDLMQYPVLPFVLADYDSTVLDLTRASSFRNLSKPIACQDKGKEERYIENYEYLKGDFEQRMLMDPENAVPPYHYSSHYSNSGTVLHFLVRLPPFTSMFLKYQDNQFDIPDRTFHSMATTWKLSSFISNTDVKELIPEFFFLQEFLENGERYDMGVRQNKERVDHVTLPAWCKYDPRLFTLIHMQALESLIVSSNIHHWVDLVFGYKQSGAAAVKATNVFHPATYFGVDVSSIKDDIHRRALQTMIETYGQTPLQLFPNPHPKRFSKPAPSIMEIMISPSAMESMILSLPAKERENSREKLETSNDIPESVLPSPMDNVIGVQWGDYCGSPSHQAPVVQWVQALSFPAKRIITSAKSLSAYLCSQSVCVLTPYNLSNVTKPIGMLAWGNQDSMLQVGSSNSHLKTAFNPMRPDPVTCCEYVPGLDILFVGGTSGVLNVWPVHFTLATSTLDVVGAKQNLLGHSDAITSICVCQSYSIAVTTSKDTTAIIWDLNRLCYIRSISGHSAAVDCVTVSESSGDIATACNEGSAGAVYLWTVNAKAIGEIKVQSNVKCLAFSSLPDGVAVNVIAAGMSNGLIKMWDTWTLQPLRSLMANNQNESVISMAFSKWNPLHFFTADDRGNVYLWTSKDLAIQKSPNFVLVSALP